MPGLNKFIEKTGSRLPTPIIDLIAVNEDSIDVTVSLKFNFVNSILDDASIDNFIEEMTDGTSPIYVYVMYVMDTDTINDLVSGKNKDPLSCLYPQVILGEPEDNFNAHTQNYVIIGLNEFTEVEHAYSEETKNLIVTLSTSAEIKSLFSIAHYGDLTLEGLVKETDRNDVTVFSFVSSINFDSKDQLEYSLIEGTMTSTETIYEKRKYNLPDSILEHMTSEISHEDLYKDSELDVGTKSLFIDGENEPYHISPINSLDNKPYTQDGISSAEIREVFRLVTKSITAESEDLQEILNSIDLITETEDDKFLLQSYEKIRLAFPEKSTVTEMGRTYELFKTRLLGVDRRVKSSPLLQERLYKSSKIVDDRTTKIAEPSPLPTQDPALTCLFANTTGDPEDEASWTSSIVIYEEGAESEPVISHFRREGFCVFDYGLAQKNHAQILEKYSLAVLEILFGSNIVNNYFKITEAQLSRKYDLSTPDGQVFLSLQESVPDPGEDDYPSSTVSYDSVESDSFWSPNFNDLLQTKFPSIIFAPADSSPNEISPLVWPDYLQIRAAPSYNSTEQFLLFQFQNVIDAPQAVDIPTEDYYELSVTVEDSTPELMKIIEDLFIDYYNGEFTEFYDYASEDCNYNTETGYFNDFFVTGVMNRYNDTTTVFPWIKMPLLLELYLQLVFNNEAESDSLIKEKAETAAALINPVNGSFTNLKSFKNKCADFIETYLTLSDEDPPATQTHTFSAQINPPAPVAFVVGEGWDIPEETVQVIAVSKYWVKHAELYTYDFGWVNWNPGNSYLSDIRKYYTKFNKTFEPATGKRLRHEDPFEEGISIDEYRNRFLVKEINDYVESVDHTAGMHGPKEFFWRTATSRDGTSQTTESLEPQIGDYKVEITVDEDNSKVYTNCWFYTEVTE